MRVRSTDALYDVVAAALVAAALIVGIHTLRGLRGAYDPDHFRDIAQAQTTRDGHPLTDPYYRGEWIWYNPLLPWTLAIGSAATGMTVEAFHVHAGPWLNLLGPIAFYVLSVRLVGRRAALAALALYLFFLVGNEHSYATATYSPWSFAGNFGQGVFFSTGFAILWAARSLTSVRALVVGALIGLTFLAHTAPAAILVVIVCAVFWPNWRALSIVALAALVVVSPFLAGIGWHYRFHILNHEPISYVYPPVSREGLSTTVYQHAVVVAMALLGLWRLRSRLLWAWLLAAVIFTASTIAGLTPFVPAFHFWLYVTAVLAILAGRTLAWVVRPAPIFIGLTLALIVWNWRAYVERPDFQNGRFLAARRLEDHLTAAQFLRTVTQPDDVVLGSDGVVRLIISPAGRKTVAPSSIFANPYVEYRSRQADRDRMLAAIEARDEKAFGEPAQRRDVHAVLTTGAESCASAEQMFPLTWRVGEVCVSVTR